ncbi:MAG: hypothetical protein O6929_07985 [candidate division NC10 bacterium]|nr:hypothetical protein [candidate division NC10 bacterium]
MPKAVIRALDPSQALRAALILANHDQVSGPVIALGAVESYFEAARRQQRRIERAKVGLLRRAAARTRSLFDEVHFYLICWARIAKLTRFIAHSTRFRRTGLVLRRYHAELTERIDGRDHLEHFEERLPGGPRRHELAIPGDLLNMAGQFLTYGGRKIDVGPASVRLLRAIVAEFQAALLFDSLEAIAAAEPNRAVVLLQRAGSQVQLTRMVKQVEGLLGSHPDQKPKPPAKERASVGSDEPRR